MCDILFVVLHSASLREFSATVHALRFQERWSHVLQRFLVISLLVSFLSAIFGIYNPLLQFASLSGYVVVCGLLLYRLFSLIYTKQWVEIAFFCCCVTTAFVTISPIVMSIFSALGVWYFWILCFFLQFNILFTGIRSCYTAYTAIRNNNSLSESERKNKMTTLPQLKASAQVITPKINTVKEYLPVHITGATGPRRGDINGVYIPQSQTYNGRILYQKQGDSDMWLRYTKLKITNGG